MKFPLVDHPFQPVELSPAQCLDYERVTDALLDETVAEYERFVHLENRTLHKKLWKPVKTREHLTVYRQTERTAAPRRVGGPQVSAASAVTIAANMHEWKLPKLLAVGSIVGTLDDVMYGVVAPDVKSMLLRSSYVSDELVDGGVLFQIKGAVAEDPFRFLGVKWLVKAHPMTINAVVSPRDTVVIDATGVRVQANGDRVGYHVMHSLLLPQCPELKPQSILRGYLSSCYLFKQTPNGTVEVYMKTFVDPGGRLSKSLATMSVANALIGCYKSVLCAQGKKLAWLIKTNAQQRRRQHKRRGGGGVSDPPSGSPPTSKQHCCELCHSVFRAYKSARGCQSCLRFVCSRCQVPRKISHMQHGLQVKQSTVVACKDCVAHAAQLSALDVARDEFVGKRTHQHSLMTDTHVASESGDSWTMSGSTDAFVESSPIMSDEDAALARFNATSFVDSNASSRSLGSRTASLEQDIAMFHSDRGQKTSIELSATPRSLQPPAVNEADHRQQLWMQMTQLRLAAEQTYMITKQNESAMRFAPQLE